jgi:hypothetical protein
LHQKQKKKRTDSHHYDVVVQARCDRNYTKVTGVGERLVHLQAFTEGITSPRNTGRL